MPTQPFVPLWSVNEYVMRVITWIMGVETIKRQTVHGCVWLAGRRSVCGRRLSLRPTGWRPLCLWHKQRRYSCGMRIMTTYKCYMPLPCPAYDQITTSNRTESRKLVKSRNWDAHLVQITWC